MFTRVWIPIVYKTPGGASSGKYFLGERCLHATIGFVVSSSYPASPLSTCMASFIPAIRLRYSFSQKLESSLIFRKIILTKMLKRSKMREEGS